MVIVLRFRILLIGSLIIALAAELHKSRLEEPVSTLFVIIALSTRSGTAIEVALIQLHEVLFCHQCTVHSQDASATRPLSQNRLSLPSHWTQVSSTGL